MLKISVVVPSLRRPTLLGKLLKRLLIQTIKPYEVIVVNHIFDRKTDDYIAVINEFKSKIRVRHFINRETSLARSYNSRY